MIIEFKIWPRNSNRITFDPFLVKKNCGKLAKSGILPIFESFLPKKGVKCYPTYILRPYLESFHHFGYFRPNLTWFPHFDFWPPMHLKKSANILSQNSFVEKMLWRKVAKNLISQNKINCQYRNFEILEFSKIWHILAKHRKNK